MTGQQEAVRAALRARQGAGARYDDPSSPAPDLRLARSGTAYFGRLLANMNDAVLDGPSRLPGISRRQIVARIGLEARILAETIAAIRAGATAPLPFALSLLSDDVDLAATLPSQALRNLFSHSEVHLNVEWRDLDATGWQAEARDTSGITVRIDATPRQRARSIWLGAYQLSAGGRLADLPAAFRDASDAPVSAH